MDSSPTEEPKTTLIDQFRELEIWSVRQYLTTLFHTIWQIEQYVVQKPGNFRDILENISTLLEQFEGEKYNPMRDEYWKMQGGEEVPLPILLKPEDLALLETILTTIVEKGILTEEELTQKGLSKVFRSLPAAQVVRRYGEQPEDKAAMEMPIEAFPLDRQRKITELRERLQTLQELQEELDHTPGEIETRLQGRICELLGITIQQKKSTAEITREILKFRLWKAIGDTRYELRTLTQKSTGRA